MLWPDIRLRKGRVLCSVFPGFLSAVTEGWHRAVCATVAGYIEMDWLGEGGESMYGVARLHAWFCEREGGVWMLPRRTTTPPPGCWMTPDGTCLRL